MDKSLNNTTIFRKHVASVNVANAKFTVEGGSMLFKKVASQLQIIATFKDDTNVNLKNKNIITFRNRKYIEVKYKNHVGLVELLNIYPMTTINLSEQAVGQPLLVIDSWVVRDNTNKFTDPRLLKLKTFVTNCCSLIDDELNKQIETKTTRVPFTYLSSSRETITLQDIKPLLSSPSRSNAKIMFVFLPVTNSSRFTFKNKRYKYILKIYLASNRALLKTNTMEVSTNPRQTKI